MAQQRYSSVAILLHWTIAAAIAFQIALGLGLEDLGPRGFALFQLHKSVGIAILLLTLLRLGWRVAHKLPPAHSHGWQGRLAGAVHAGLYVVMIGAPLTGWLLVSTEAVKVPTLLFGTVHWPHLPASHDLNGAAHLSHALLSWIGIGLIVLHVAGALRHQWLLRDGVMARITPGRMPWLVPALLLPLGAVIGVVMLNRVGPAPSVEPAPVAATQPGAVLSKDAPAEAKTPVEVPPDTAEPAPPPVWTIRPGGTLAFSASHSGGTVNGRFTRWRGRIHFDPDRPGQADIRISVDLTSATTGDPTQDAMLSGADFLNSAAFPQAVFTANAARRTGPERYAATGKLSLKGVSRAQPISFTLSGSGLARHVEGRATIDRKAYGIGTGEAAETILPSVTLTFAFDAKGQAGP